MLWSVGRAELLDDRHGPAVVGGELAAAIGTQVLKVSPRDISKSWTNSTRLVSALFFVEMKW